VVVVSEGRMLEMFLLVVVVVGAIYQMVMVMVMKIHILMRCRMVLDPG